MTNPKNLTLNAVAFFAFLATLVGIVLVFTVHVAREVDWWSNYRVEHHCVLVHAEGVDHSYECDDGKIYNR